MYYVCIELQKGSNVHTNRSPFAYFLVADIVKTLMYFYLDSLYEVPVTGLLLSGNLLYTC